MATQKGFTLIELMTALALSAILLSMAVPALDAFTTNARQTGAINDFVASMHLARSTAITTNRRVTVCASSSGAACDGAAWTDGWIAFTDANSSLSVDGNDAMLTATDAIDDLTMQPVGLGNVFLYRPNGRVLNAGAGGNSGQFVVCDDRGDAHAKVIIIDLSGRPRLSKVRADGTEPGCIG